MDLEFEEIGVGAAGAFEHAGVLNREHRAATDDVVVGDLGVAGDDAAGERILGSGLRAYLQCEGLEFLDGGVAEHLDLDDRLELAGEEGDGAAGGHVVLAGEGRAVEGLEVERKILGGGARQAQVKERDLAAGVALDQLRAADREHAILAGAIVVEDEAGRGEPVAAAFELGADKTRQFEHETIVRLVQYVRIDSQAEQDAAVAGRHGDASTLEGL